MRLNRLYVVALMLILGATIHIKGQEKKGLYVNTDKFKVKSGTKLSVEGSLIVSDSGNIDNGGEIYVKDSLVNHSSELFSSSSFGKLINDNTTSDVVNIGYVIFSADANQYIKNNGMILFDSIIVQKTDSLVLLDSIHLLGQLEFKEGLVSLNGQKAYLYFENSSGTARRSGTLGKESGVSRIVDTLGKGYVDVEKSLTDGGNDSFSTIGIDLDYKGGVTRIKRYHYHDSLVADTSIGKVFQLVYTSKSGAEVNAGFKYIPEDLLSGINEDSLMVWNYISSDNISDFSSCSYLDTMLYVMSEGNNEAFPALDSVTGTLLFSVGNKFTLAQRNCDNPPPVDLGADTAFCQGDIPMLTPFKEDVNWCEYLYDWGASIDITPTGTTDAYEYGFDTKDMEDGTEFRVGVTVRDLRGCQSTDSITIKINGASDVALQLFDTAMNPGYFSVCQGEPFIIKDTNNTDTADYNYTWWFEGDTLLDKNNAIQQTLSVPGDTIKFGVRYINENGCVQVKHADMTVNPLPNVGLYAEGPLCAQTLSLIKNTTTIPRKNPVSAITYYEWTVDDIDKIYVSGGSSSENGSVYKSETLSASSQSPDLEFKFEDAGYKKIHLLAKSSAQCVSKDSVTLYVNPVVTASFMPNELSDVCNGTASVLVPETTTTKVSKEGYAWQVSTSVPWIQGDTATWQFSGAGEYNVKLAIMSDSGCVDTTSGKVTIHPNAVANFSVNNVCDGFTTQVTNNSQNADTYQWDFGNGQTSTNYDHAWKYDTSGIYTIALKANNTWNCADSVEKSAEVYKLPDVGFDVDGGICINEQEGIVQNTSETGLDFYWTFGDGTFSSERTPDKIYDESGTYNITLTGTSEEGCQTALTKPVEVNSLVTAAFDPTSASVCKGAVSSFSPTGTLSGLDSVTWMLGDGNENTLEASSPGMNYTYSNAGMYLASLVTISNNGCRDTTSKEIIISPNPTFEIEAEGQACTGTEVVFHVNDEVSVDEIAAYDWNFDDAANPINNISTIPVPSHFFETANTYNVALKLVTQQGCIGYDTLSLTVNALPEIVFADETGTCDAELDLEAVSGSPSGFSYVWDDGSTAPVKHITADGVSSVTVTNISTGCSTYKETDVKLSSSILPGLGSDVDACDYLLLDAHNPGASYQWSTGATTRTVQITTSGSYSVIVTDNGGCTGYDTIHATIHASPELILPETSNFCEGGATVLDPQVSSGTFEWSTGATTPTLSVTDAGYYWVKVSNANGCADQVVTSVVINPLPVVELGNNIEVCENVSLSLNAGNPGSTYGWNTGETTQTIQPGASGSYSVEVTNTYGCSNSDDVWVTLNPLPIVNLESNISICEGSVQTLDAGVASKYYWSTNETTQAVQVTEAGDYWVRVTDANNCTNTSNIAQVVVKEIPEQPFLTTSLASCSNVLLDAVNPGATYLWSDGNTSRNNYIENSGQVWVDITNAEGCSISDTIVINIKPVATVDLPTTLEVCSNGYSFLDAGYFGSDYTYQWNTGSSEQYIKAASSGWYKVEVTHAEGCVASDSTYVTTKAAPQIDLPTETVLCANSGMTLDAGTPGSLYSWENSLGETYTGQIWEIQDPATYWVYVFAANGCSNSDTTTVRSTNMSITPHFMVASDLSVGDTARFVDLSVPDPVEYLWDFGDMITSTDEGPEHIYYTEDTFNVKLTVSNTVCSASVTKPISVSGYNTYYLMKLEKEQGQGQINIVKIENVQMYPNPVTDNLTIKVSITQPETLALYLYAMNGQVLKQEQFDGVEDFEYSLNLSGYPQGMYFVRLATRNEAKTYKILKLE